MRRIIRIAVCVSAGLVVGVSLYARLVEFGPVQSPFATLISGDLALARSDRAGLRVLFVGNSFTSENSLPSLVHQLAAGAPGGPIFTVSYTADGATLRRASRAHELEALLMKVRWSVVVLQEQSQIPSFSASFRSRELVPFARVLATEITAVGARTMLFMTWGYKNGDRQNIPGDTFAWMQERLRRGYADLAAQLSAPVAPVGLAWAEALRGRPELDLWSSDGKHPDRLGSYLAACVFYAVLSRRDPAASTFTGGISKTDAAYLQQVAWDVVEREQGRTTGG